jgi:uncharacterized protein
MFVVDTNVLLYAAHESSPEHALCREHLEGWRRDPVPWFVTWPICYEFLRVATHPRMFERPWTQDAAMGFLEAIFASPALAILTPGERHGAILQQTIREIPGLTGNIAHDLHTAVLMREHGISRIYTRDTHFHRFPFLTVLDPLHI